MRRCVPQEEQLEILSQCHSSPYGGHFRSQNTAPKVFQSYFFGLACSRTLINMFRTGIDVKEWVIFLK